MDFVEALRIKAMLDVMEGDFLYQYRRICRWYSEHFSTPLPQVEELSEEDVLRTFFEYQFENMSKAARRKLAIEMTETEDEAKARKAKEEDKSDEAFVKRMKKKAKKDEKKAVAKLERQAKEAAAKIAALADMEMTGSKRPPPPDISLKFDPDGNLMDEESIPVPPPRKR